MGLWGCPELSRVGQLPASLLMPMVQPAGVVVDSCSVTHTRGCVVGKGYLTGTGVGWALDTRRLTCAPA